MEDVPLPCLIPEGNSYGNSNVDPYVMSTSMFAYASTTPGAIGSPGFTSPDPLGACWIMQDDGGPCQCRNDAPDWAKK